MFGWVVSQMLAFAVGRALPPLQSRYFDILLIGTTINFVSAFWLFQRDAPIRRSLMTWRSFALAAWLLVLALSLTRPQRHLPDQIEEWRTMLATGSKNVQSYLATGTVPLFSGCQGRRFLYSLQSGCASYWTRRRFAPPCRQRCFRSMRHTHGSKCSRPVFSGSAAFGLKSERFSYGTGRWVAALRDKAGYALGRQFGSRDC